MSNPMVIALMVQVNLGDDPNIAKSMTNNWDGLVLKESNSTELVHVIKNIARVFESISKEAVKQAGAAKEPDIKGKELLSKLNENEQKILRLVAEGKTNKEIAELIYRTPGRVKNIVSEILSKLYLGNRYQLVKYVYENNLLNILKE
jgi:DNA-binding NarL/FixJ family response regulator